GDTVAQIAAEKAGIVKDAAPVASAVQLASAEEVIRRACERCESPLSFVDADSIQGTPWDFSYKDLEHLRLGMIGSYQTENAALAIEAVGLLRAQGFSIPDPAIREGLAQTRWPGRFELVSENPAVIVDGGHNPQGARALADSLRLGFPGKKAVFVMGGLADKDSRQMVCPLLDLAQAFVCVEPPNPRALPAGELAALLQDACAQGASIPVECADGFEDALRRAFDLAGEDGIVCACGSLYSVASVMEGLRSLKTMRCK
ncbi:MAG: cyanophycin synthetase, partial [Eggerthellaceae bacterium]|nr:cyanophycin synthetase [Eggerthellaceae bacterium]